MTSLVGSVRRAAPAVALFAACALLAAGCGDSSSSAGATGPSASAAPASSVVTDPTVGTTLVSATTTSSTNAPTTTGPSSCSASNLSGALAPESGLPQPVEAMRDDLARAAVMCDFQTLGTLADRTGVGVRYSFGEPGDPVQFWRDAERDGGGVPPMLALRTLLGLPFGTQTLDDGSVQYIWPRAFASDQPTAAELREIADTGLYPLATLQDWVQSGTNYLGYRILIKADGDWTAFVSGD